MIELMFKFVFLKYIKENASKWGKKFSCQEGPLIEGSEDGEEEKVLSKWSVCHETSYILVNRITSGNLVYLHFIYKFQPEIAKNSQSGIKRPSWAKN